MNKGGAIFVMSTFAFVWWAVGMGGLGHHGQYAPVMTAVGTVISVLFISLGWRHRGPAVAPGERKRRRRIVGIASAVEGALIFAAVILLRKVGRPDLIMPAVAIIVGLHFLPLAHGFRAPIYYLTAALLVAVGIAGAVVEDLQSRILTVGIGAAAVLWLACGVMLRADRTVKG